MYKRNVLILDCTLRDGGYINNWEFGSKTIDKVISNLVESQVDIIECGFLSNAKDEKLLTNESWQGRLAETIAAGVMEYLSQSAS